MSTESTSTIASEASFTKPSPKPTSKSRSKSRSKASAKASANANADADADADGDGDADATSERAPKRGWLNTRFKKQLSSVHEYNHYEADASTPLPASEASLLLRFTWYIHYVIIADLEGTLSSAEVHGCLQRLEDLYRPSSFFSSSPPDSASASTSVSASASASAPYSHPELVGDFSHLGDGLCEPYVQGFVCIEHSTASVVVAFAGIKYPKQLFNTLDGLPAQISWAAAAAAAPDGTTKAGAFYAHAGFLRLYGAVRKDMLEMVRAALDRVPEYGLVIVGYSQGSALATLAALDLVLAKKEKASDHNEGEGEEEEEEQQEEGGEGGREELLAARRVSFYAYSSPRVLTGPAAEFLTQRMEARGMGCYRVVREGDVVPLLPPMVLGYRHVGRRVYGVCGARIPRKVKIVDDDAAREGNVFSAAGVLARWGAVLGGLRDSERFHTDY